MIGNRAIQGRTNTGEGNDHFQTKVIAGQLADSFISRMLENECKIITLYEFPFIPLKLEIDQINDYPDRCYVGDVVILFYYNMKLYKRMHEKMSICSWEDLQRSADYMWNIEIDGKRGHGTATERKNRSMRDEALMRHYNIPVLRIPWFNAKERKQQDTYEAIEDEIKDFYVKYRRQQPEMII